MREFIKKRRSTRHYDSTGLSERELHDVKECIREPLILPFSKAVDIKLLPSDVDASRLARYGILRGKTHALAFLVADHREAYLNLGYLLAHLDLLFEAKGIHRLMAGGTYQREKAASLLSLKEDEHLMMLLFLGHGLPSPHFRERIMKTFLKTERMELSKILLGESRRLSEKQKESLENLRLSPSSINSQPWRVEVEDEAFHFYMKLHPKCGEAMNLIDMGIGLYNSFITLEELHAQPVIRRLMKKNRGELQYIASIQWQEKSEV